MTPDIALILGIDGIATGSIYVLVGLGLVLIFSVTRVVFVPFGDIVAFSALTLASLQLGRMPGTVYLVAELGGGRLRCRCTVHHLAPRPSRDRIGRGLLGYGVLPLIPAAVAWLFAGASLPTWAQIPLAIALVVPIAPLIERIALRPIADASVLLLLIVSVALTFALSGLGLLFFGPEGFRTKPLTTRSLPFRQRDRHVADAADGRDRHCVQPAAVPVLRAYARRQGAARDRGQSRRRAHRRHPAGEHRRRWRFCSPRCSAPYPAF